MNRILGLTVLISFLSLSSNLDQNSIKCICAFAIVFYQDIFFRTSWTYITSQINVLYFADLEKIYFKYAYYTYTIFFNIINILWVLHVPLL